MNSYIRFSRLKLTFSAIIVVLLFSVGCTEDEAQITDNKNNILENVFKKSSVHSDFLGYAHSNGAYNGEKEKILIDTFIDSYDSFKSYSPEEKMQIKEMVAARRLPHTKNNDGSQNEYSEIRKLSEDILLQLSDLEDCVGIM